MTLAKPVEDGRRPKDVVRMFTIELAKAKLSSPSGDWIILAPDRGVYEIHTCQSGDGTWHWVALYSGERPLNELLVGQPEWTEAAAERQVADELRYLEKREAEKRAESPAKRVW